MLRRTGFTESNPRSLYLSYSPLGVAKGYWNKYSPLGTGYWHGGAGNAITRIRPDGVDGLYWDHDTSRDYRDVSAYLSRSLPSDRKLVDSLSLLTSKEKRHQSWRQRLSSRLAAAYFARKYDSTPRFRGTSGVATTKLKRYEESGRGRAYSASYKGPINVKQHRLRRTYKVPYINYKGINKRRRRRRSSKS